MAEDPSGAAVDGLGKDDSTVIDANTEKNTHTTEPQLASPELPRTYRCDRWPFLNIADKVKFEDRLFTATTEEQVRLIESRPYFGAHVSRVEEGG